MDAASLFMSPNPAFAGSSETANLIIRKNTFVGTSFLAIVVDLAKYLFSGVRDRRFEDFSAPAHSRCWSFTDATSVGLGLKPSSCACNSGDLPRALSRFELYRKGRPTEAAGWSLVRKCEGIANKNPGASAGHSNTSTRPV
jgi:hypothetical protein